MLVFRSYCIVNCSIYFIVFVIEIATGADPNHPAVDVERLLGTQAEEPAATGRPRGGTSVGTRVSGLQRARRHVPAAAPASVVMP